MCGQNSNVLTDKIAVIPEQALQQAGKNIRVKNETLLRLVLL